MKKIEDNIEIIIPDKNICVGFFLRAVSDVLDIFFLAALGFLLSFPCRPLFMHLGEHGIIFGVFFVFLYFTILNSEFGEGQTIAKKILKIEVIGFDGNYLSIWKSFLRYSLVVIVIYNGLFASLLGIFFPALVSAQLLFVGIPAVVLILFFGESVYLSLHPLKQGFHDLLGRSIVVRKNTFSPELVKHFHNDSRQKKAFFIWAGLSFFVIVFFISFFIMATPIFNSVNQMFRTSTKISLQTDFSNSIVQYQKGVVLNNQFIEKKIVTLYSFSKSSVFMNQDKLSENINKSLEIIKETYLDTGVAEYVCFRIRTGFNIGIASAYETKVFFFDKTGMKVDVEALIG